MHRPLADDDGGVAWIGERFDMFLEHTFADTEVADDHREVALVGGQSPEWFPAAVAASACEG